MSLQIIDDNNAIDWEKVSAFMADSHWQSDIGPETLKRSLQNSMCFTALADRQHVGFARVVTDKATFAWIDDVYVDVHFRRQGIAEQLISTIIHHPQLASVATWFLASSNPDARNVFSKLGFEPLAEERSKKLMARPKVQNALYRN